MNELTENERFSYYVRLKWISLAVIGALPTFLAVFGVINWFSAGAVLGVVCLAGAVNLWLSLAIKQRRGLVFAGHFSLVTDITLIIGALYLAGGMENTWLFNPVIIVYAAGYVFSLGISLFYAGFAFSLLSLMFFLEYNHLIPHFPAYGLPELYWRYPQYCIDYLSGMFVLYFIAAVTSGLFNRAYSRVNTRLRTSLTESEAAKQEAESARNVMQPLLTKLEKAQAELLGQNQELTETKKLLEEKTRHIEKQMAELKEFNDMAVGRELKMIELEKELARLKGA